MALTRLGWDVYTSSSNANLVNFPWITGKVRRGDFYTVLDAFCKRYHNEVEPIRRDWSWGYNYRSVRGAAVYSEHSAGVALDLNAPKHPLGTQPTANFSAAQIAKIHQILKDFDGVIRWGGDYAGRKDPMHWEVQGGVAKVKAVAKKLSGGSVAPVGERDDPKPGKPRETVKQSAKNRPDGRTTFPTDYEDLAIDKVAGELTYGAHQILMRAIGYKKNKQWDGEFGKLTLSDTIDWMQGLGYYVKTPVTKWGVRKGTPLIDDGKAGRWFWFEFQRLLSDRDLYDRALDGDPQGYTVAGWQAYLNQNNGS